MLRALVGVLLCVAVPPAWSATIGFEPSASNSFSVGQSFTLTLGGSDFAVPLDGGGINLQFDPSVLQVESVTVDTGVWDFAPVNGTLDNNSGAVEDILFNALLNPSPSGTFDIASVQFLALAGGTSDLLLSASASNPFSSGGVVLNPGTDFTFQPSTVNVTAVPLPGSLELLTDALLAMLVAASAVARGTGLPTLTSK